MRLKIISDQHMEFRTEEDIRQYLDFFHPREEENPSDVCIMAGDFDTVRGRTFLRFKAVCEREKEVFYVPGNHDYYHGLSVGNTDLALAEIEKALPNFHVLRSYAELFCQGRRFLGDTMWVRDTPSLRAAENQINDPVQIQNLYRDIPWKNQAFLAYLEKDLRAGDIVVTHHLPSERSTPPAFIGSPLQPWFVCNVEALIMERQPALWIHGHTHGRCDYKIGETRIFCNPLGYPSETSNFSRQIPCVIEV